MKLLTWPLRLLGFVLWYLGQILATNVRVIVDILTPADRSHPVIVRFPTRCRGEFGTALFAILVSLTPGTLVLATRGDAASGFEVYVHSLYADADALAVDLARLETRMLAAVRPGGDPR